MPHVPAVTFPVLVLNGTVGVGKTTIGHAISEILAGVELPHAFVDRDALSMSWPPRGRFNVDLANRNLAAVWMNFRAHGAERLIVAGVLESTDDVDALRAAVPGAAIMVCRLRASAAVREMRLRAREHGVNREWHLARSSELETILDRVAIDDFAVENDGRPLVAVAHEILARAAWPPAHAPMEGAPRR